MSSIVHPLKTIFFGTPQFAVPALEALVHDRRFEVVGVVTQPDKPVGRKQVMIPSPVKIFAEANGLKVLQPSKLKEVLIQDEILALKPELAVVVAYGKIIPSSLLQAVPRGFVNLHPSLLPKHRGAAPITAAILDGDKETGVCLMLLDEQLDHGPIIACRRVKIDTSETSESLRAKLTPLSADMIAHELLDWLDGKIMPVEQDHGQATFCKPIESEDARIDWSKPAAEIDRFIRAMHGVTPAWTTLCGQTLLVHKTSLRASASERGNLGLSGTIAVIDKKLVVAAIDGYLIFDEFQPAGGKPMSGQAFLNGHRDIIGKQFV